MYPSSNKSMIPDFYQHQPYCISGTMEICWPSKVPLILRKNNSAHNSDKKPLLLCEHVEKKRDKDSKTLQNYKLYQKLFSVLKIFVLNLESRIFRIYCANEFKFFTLSADNGNFSKKSDKPKIAFWNFKSISFIITLGKTGACCLTMTSRTKLK